MQMCPEQGYAQPHLGSPRTSDRAGLVCQHKEQLPLLVPPSIAAGTKYQRAMPVLQKCSLSIPRKAVSRAQEIVAIALYSNKIGCEDLVTLKGMFSCEYRYQHKKQLLNTLFTCAVVKKNPVTLQNSLLMLKPFSSGHCSLFKLDIS